MIDETRQKSGAKVCRRTYPARRSRGGGWLRWLLRSLVGHSALLVLRPISKLDVNEPAGRRAVIVGMNSGPISGTRTEPVTPDPALPDHEVVRLLSVATGRTIWELRGSVELTAVEADQFAQLVRRRQAHEPLQYLEGTVQFGPLVLGVDERVLVPRPETEYLYELAVGSVGSPRVIVDLCTGSGALALSLKHRFPAARVIGSDLSADALEVAAANGWACGIDVEWCRGDLFSALPDGVKGSIDLLVANPPYVAEAEWPGLPADVRREPYQALVAGPTGTELIRRLLIALPGWMATGGAAWIEIGENQGARLADEFGGQIVVDQHQRNRFLHWQL